MANSLAQDIHALLQCQNLQELLDTARQGMKSPLILADLTFHVLAITAEKKIEDSRWNEIYTQRGLPLNMVNISLYQSSLRARAPVLSTDSTGLSIVRSAVARDNKIIGYLLSPGYGGPPSQEELDLVNILSDLCALRMQKDLHYAEYPENMLEYFISDLLNGAITDEQKILDRCRFFKWRLRAPYRVLTICRKKKSPKDKETGTDHLTLEEHKVALQRRFPDATAFVYGSQIKLIIHVYDETTRNTLILRDVETFLRDRKLVAGVSQTAYRLGRLSSRHQQAMKAIEMGLLLDSKEVLFHYEVYSVYHCLEICAQQGNLLQMCHTAVRKLESYDRKNNTELLGTLHAYLSCHRNLSDASAALYVHRNTLSKRLEKINDLINVDFSDAETVFHLMFSYRILEYYGATEMRDSYENWMERSPMLRHP